MQKFPLREAYLDTRDHRGMLNEFTSGLIERYLLAFRIELTGDGGWTVCVDEQVRVEVELLKAMIFHYVIHNPVLAIPQYGQKRMIQRIFDAYYDRSARELRNVDLLPMAWSNDAKLVQETGGEELRRLSSARLVLDFIASLTEKQTMALDARLQGSLSGSVYDHYV